MRIYKVHIVSERVTPCTFFANQTGYVCAKKIFSVRFPDVASFQRLPQVKRHGLVGREVVHVDSPTLWKMSKVPFVLAVALMTA